MASPEEIAAMKAQILELTEGLKRANSAYQVQQERLNRAEQALEQAQTTAQTAGATAQAAGVTAQAAGETAHAAGVAAQAAAAPREHKQLIHPSNVPKPHQWNGKKEEWEKFRHVFTAWSSTVHARYPSLLEKFGASKDPVDDAVFTDEEDQLSKAMYTFLIQYCPEPTMGVVGQGLPNANGFEVWRRLVQLSEPAYRTKAWIWRKHLANPSFPSDPANWSSALHQWESELREFERAFKTPMTDDEKISIIAHVAPKELQQSIFMHSDALDTYTKIRGYIEQYLINKNLWKRPHGSQFGLTKVANKVSDNPVDDGGQRDMDIGAMGDKGKAKGKDRQQKKDRQKQWPQQQPGNKGKDKNNKGKEGGKGKGKGDGKPNNKGKEGKGKDKNNKGKGVGNPHAGKQCHICNKYGHIAADCWWKIGSVEEGDSTQPGAAETLPAAGTGGSSTVGSISPGFSIDNVIFAIGENRVAAVKAVDDHHYVLVDSGACESVAKVGDFKEPVDKSGARPLYSVQGTPLNVYGKQYPHIAVGNLEGVMEMTVTDAAETLLSVHSLVQRGHQVHFTPEASYMITKDGEHLPLELHGKRWYLRVKKLGTKPGEHRSQDRVAPVAPADRGRDDDEGVDSWKVEAKDGDEYLIRVHVIRRVCLFSPDRVKDIPVPLDRVLPGRLTKITYALDGATEERQGVWTEKRLATKSMKKAWTGESWFKLKPAPESSGPLHEDPPEWFEDYYPSDVEGGHEELEVEAKPLQRAVDDGDAEPSPSAVSVPYQPTDAEMQLHRLHHANFEPWCETCVQGQGRSKPHYRATEDSKNHVVYSDYMFFTKEGRQVAKDTKEKGLITVLTAIDKDSQYPFASVVPAKGAGVFAVEAMAKWIEQLGWDKVIVQIDQENALGSLYDKVKLKMPDKMTIRRSPKYSPQSLADGEMVNGLIAGKIRTWMAEIAKGYGEELRCDSVLFPWVVRHTAWTLARYHLNKSKTTPFRVVHGHDYTGELIPLGETVMAKFSASRQKAAPRWTKGIYAGKTVASDEHLVLTNAGVETVRTIRRLPAGSQFQLEALKQARGTPWNTLAGSERVRPQEERSKPAVTTTPTAEPEELFDFHASAPATPTPLIVPAPSTSARKSEDVSAPKSPSEDIGQPTAKKLRTEPGADVPGDTGMPGGTGEPQRFNIATPGGSMATGSDGHSMEVSRLNSDASMLEPGEASQRMISAIANDGEWKFEAKGTSSEDIMGYRRWLQQHRGCFSATMVANIMDYLDTLSPNEADLKQARREEIRKLNDVFGAFTPRDRRELPKDITVFGHRWVDKVNEGRVKSRLTCQDFKRKQTSEERHSSEGANNFCPTPHAASRKVLEVYSLKTGLPRVKVDLTSAFLIAKDSGDDRGQPVMMRPPAEWLEEFDTWLLKQPKAVQEELSKVPKEHLVWQVDGNIYGRQPAAASYRDRLEDILLNKLPKDQYSFKRGKLDACIYKCKLTGIVLIHHIDDFDICGPEEMTNDLLLVQLPKNGCKVKVGEYEYPGRGSQTSTEYLGRTKINTENAVITKPNKKHIDYILTCLGLEEAKPSPVPGRKLELKNDQLLNEEDKALYASCVGSAIYLSQDRADIKFSVKELARRIREPRVCDMQNLKILGRYLQGTKDLGHVSVADARTDDSIDLHCYCDSDWAGDEESRKSTSGEILFLGGTAVECNSHTQPGTPATSSGEAEIRALNHCALSALFIRNLAQEDFGMTVNVPRLWCDSSAALQAAKRIGVGKMRHIEIAHLVIQDLVKTKKVIIGKIDGSENPADRCSHETSQDRR